MIIPPLTVMRRDNVKRYSDSTWTFEKNRKDNKMENSVLKAMFVQNLFLYGFLTFVLCIGEKDAIVHLLMSF